MEGYKSGKQRRAEIKAARRERRQALRERSALLPALARGPAVPVDRARLMAHRSYGPSLFVLRGFYVDEPFRCSDCGAECVWTAERQRWWYEVAGGSQYAGAKRCHACRQRERQRKERARQASLAGSANKQARLAVMAARA
jgi:hypothetical protein